MRTHSLLLGSVALMALSAAAYSPFDDLGHAGGYSAASGDEPDPKRTGDAAEDDASDNANEDVLDREDPDKGSGDGDTNDKTGNDEQRNKGGDVG